MLYGQSDAAHLIAPLAIATSLGLDRAAVRLSVPFVLGLNGNAITVAPSLAAGITGGEAGLPGAVEAGKRFAAIIAARAQQRSEEHTSELQSLMRISYAVFCLKKKTKNNNIQMITIRTTYYD